MKRRQVLQQLALISAGALLVPSCVQEKRKSSIVLKNISIDGSDEQLLAEICDTIIPATETPGAKDVYAHLFVLKMVDDCRGKDEQQKFIKGLGDFRKLSKDQLGTSFERASPQQRLTLLQSLNKSEGKRDIDMFFETAKGLTIQAYTTSQYFMTKVKVFEMIPGRWKGCVPVKADIKLA